MLVTETRAELIGFEGSERDGWLFMLTACARDPAPALAAPAPTASYEPELAVLPNNTVLQCARSSGTAVHREGDVAWELTLPYGDALVAAPAVALNSVAYFSRLQGRVRGPA